MKFWSIGRMTRYVAQMKYFEKLKQDEALCVQAFPKAKFLMFSDYGTKPLLSMDPATNKLTMKLTLLEETKKYCGSDFLSKVCLVGMDDEGSDETVGVFSALVEESDSEQDGETKSTSPPAGSKFSDMRSSFTRLTPKDISVVSRGYALLSWNRTTKYCSECASPLKRNTSGTVLTCYNCLGNKKYYPPINPVAITLVENTETDEVLLVRQPRHPPGMYSCIAGFIEPGENLEEAVRREIAEEAGIVVGAVTFFSSQTWTFPQNSLMLGCKTVAMPDQPILEIDKTELEDAKWFTRQQVKQAMERIQQNPKLFRDNPDNLLIIPPSGAIAHDLLKTWLN